MTRLFVAIKPPEEILQALQRVAPHLSGTRAVKEESLHITLRFIGNVESPEVDAIDSTLSRIKGRPFDLRLRGVGHFPPRGRPKGLWVGVERSDPLHAVQGRIERALVSYGLEPERRKFKPHITVGRIKDTPSHQIAEYMAVNGTFVSDPFEITHFHLYQSTLNSGGSIYDILETYPLVGK